MNRLRQHGEERFRRNRLVDVLEYIEARRGEIFARPFRLVDDDRKLRRVLLDHADQILDAARTDGQLDENRFNLLPSKYLER